MSIREYAREEWAALGSFWRTLLRIDFWILAAAFCLWLSLSFHAGRAVGFEEFNRVFFSTR